MTSLLAKGNVDINTKGILHKINIYRKNKIFLRSAKLQIKTRFLNVSRTMTLIQRLFFMNPFFILFYKSCPSGIGFFLLKAVGIVKVTNRCCQSVGTVQIFWQCL